MRVARLSEEPVGRVHVGREFRRVRLAYKDSARAAQPLNRDRVLLGDVVCAQERAESRAEAFGLEVVLGDEGHALERPRLFSAPEAPVTGLSLREGVGIDRADGVDGGVELLDPPQKVSGEIARADLAARHEGRERAAGHLVQRLAHAACLR